MSDRALEQMPMRELFVHAEHQARELAEHLDLNFLPKLQLLDELLHPKAGAEEAEDITVRHRAAEILESDGFTQQKLQKMDDCLNAIDGALRRRTE
ncbi:MAG: hypothetical protein V4719_21675 [Planctomycetota bacterium]